MKVKVGVEVCESCCYFSARTETCDFALVNHKSRLYTNGVRIEDGYCDNYCGGERVYNAHAWKNAGVVEKRKIKEAVK